MRRLFQALLVLALVAIPAAVSPTRAFACDCPGITTQRAFTTADAVFTGTVQQIEQVGPRGQRRADIRFSVTRVYKGTVYASQLVASPFDAETCGLTPQLGSSWVIFANEAIEGSGDDSVRRLRTTVCSGNLPTGVAPVLLGRGVEPRPGESDREERAERTDVRLTRGLAIAGLGVVGLLVLVGGGLVFLWRPDRQPS